MRVARGMCLWVLAVAVLVVGWVSTAQAETRSVIDVLVINLRDAPSATAETVALLRTGESFEVLGAQGNYLRVRTQDGAVGWVPQQYTTTETPKAQVIAELRRQLTTAKQQRAETEDERARLQTAVQQAEQRQTEALASVTQELAAARDKAQASAAEYQRVKKDYDALLEKSKRVLEISAERDELREKYTQVEARMQQLNDELASVTRSKLLTGLLMGGGLVLAGWLIGSTSRKKKSRLIVG